MVVVGPNLKSIVDHDGAVILDISQDALTTLDAIGAYVWQRLKKGIQVDAIVAELVRDSGADPEMVAKDLEEFMDHLKSRNLIVNVRDSKMPGSS